MQCRTWVNGPRINLRQFFGIVEPRTKIAGYVDDRGDNRENVKILIHQG